MKNKLKLSDLKVESFITEQNAVEIKGGVNLTGTLTGTETWSFPCTHGGGTTCSPTNPLQCDIQGTAVNC